MIILHHFINRNSLFNICDLKFYIKYLNLINFIMLPNILYSHICNCIDLQLVNG